MSEVFFMDKILKDIGSRIRQARKNKQLSQAELAELMNVSTPYVSDIENGKTNFSIESFIRLTEALQTSSDWLLQTNIPEVTTIQSNEINELLSDCTSSETQMLIKMLTEMKNTLHHK